MTFLRVLPVCLFLGSIAVAQSTCPPFQFVRPSEAQILPPNTTGEAWLQRLADGSFTKQTALGNWPFDFQMLPAVPGFEQQFFSCTGLPPRTVKAQTGWHAGANLPYGRPSVTSIAGDFLGTGSISRACIGPCNAPAGQLQTVLSGTFGNIGSGTTNYVVPGGSPQALIAADVNNDGKRDLIVVSPGPSETSPGTVHVYLMNADGSLQAPIPFSAGAGAVAVAAYDLNADGKLDLVVANRDERSIMVFLGNGDGSFQKFSTIQTNAPPLSIAIADVNGDGRADIISAAGLGGLVVFSGFGQGSFDAGTPTPTSDAANITYVVADDIDKDGRIDLVALDAGLNSIIILMGREGPYLVSRRYIAGTQVTSFLLTDFDWDGNLDIVFASGHPDVLGSTSSRTTISVLFGNGDGTFHGMNAMYGHRSQPVSATIADFNNDGVPDMALTPGALGMVYVALSQGTSGFQGTNSIVIVTDEYGTRGTLTGVAAADFNGDGKIDLALTEVGRRRLYILPGKGDGNFGTGSFFSSTTQSAAGLAAGDLNGDGKPDLVIANGTAGNVLVFLNDGSGGFNGPAAFPSGPAANRVMLADVNSDGKPDLVVTNGVDINLPGGVTVLIGNGDGTFQPPSTYATLGFARFATVADVNGDSKPDLIAVGAAANGANSLFVYLNQGNGTFTALPATATIAGATQVAVADFTLDGKADLLVGHCCGETAVMTLLTGKGDGSFQGEVPVIAGTSHSYLFPVSLNGDSKPDVLLTMGAETSTIAMMVNVGVAPTGQAGVPTITSPASGTVFSSNSATFSWTAVANATRYRLTIGSAAAGSDIASQETTATTLSLSTLPTDGRSVYASVAAFVNGAYGTAGTATYQAANIPQSPAITSPVSGSTLSSGSTTISWTAVTGATKYRLSIGSASGGSDLFSQEITGLSQNVIGLPTDGRSLYASIAAFVGSAYGPSGTATYKASSAVGTPVITSPTAGSAFTLTSATFSWTAVSGATKYRITIGSAAGGSDLFTQETTTTSLAASGLPVDGRTLYVAVSGFVSGAYGPAGTATFIAASATGPLAFVIPAPGSTLSANTATFSWTNITGTAKYKLTIGSTPAGADVFQAETTGTSLTAGSLPTDGRTLYVSVAAFLGAAYGTPVNATYQSQSVQPPLQSQALQFIPLSPCRVADTRNSTGPYGAPAISANSSRSFTLPGSPCGIPSSARAYSLNVTVVPQGPLAYLTIWPTGQPQPGVSTLNSADGRVKANAAIVPAGAGGAVSVFATNTADVILDINGYFVPAALNSNGLQFYTLAPCRIADTRNLDGPYGGPALTAGGTRTIPVTGNCGVPAGAQAYSLNFTAVPKGPLAFLTTWPTGQNQPLVSTLNAPTGAVTANAAIVPVGANGSIDLFAYNATDVVVDINGYFAPPGSGGLSLYPVTPCRIADTRNPAGPFGGPTLTGSTSRSWSIAASNCGIPSGAKAYALNATVVPVGPLSYLTLWPAASGQPLVSTLNSGDGSIVSNAAIVPASPIGAISGYVTSTTDLILDISGYFSP